MDMLPYLQRFIMRTTWLTCRCGLVASGVSPSSARVRNELVVWSDVVMSKTYLRPPSKQKATQGSGQQRVLMFVLCAGRARRYTYATAVFTVKSWPSSAALEINCCHCVFCPIRNLAKRRLASYPHPARLLCNDNDSSIIVPVSLSNNWGSQPTPPEVACCV